MNASDFFRQVNGPPGTHLAALGRFNHGLGTPGYVLRNRDPLLRPLRCQFAATAKAEVVKSAADLSSIIALDLIQYSHRSEAAACILLNVVPKRKGLTARYSRQDVSLANRGPG